ncbi:hypothetical protein PILCRDRAFT_15963, partial [Piloderma croceum F 1598]
LAGEDTDASTLPNFDAEATMPFRGTFTYAFPALRPPAQHGFPSSPFMNPPGILYPRSASRAIYDPSTSSPIERQSTGGLNYTGSFSPLAEVNEESASSSPPRKAQYSPLDEERKVSRFGFARGRQGSTAASSPLHVSSPLSNNGDSHTSFYNSNKVSAPPRSSQWPTLNRQQEYGHSQPGPLLNSPLAQHAQAQTAFSQQQSRFQSFDSGVSEAQLRELIQSSRERAGPTTNDSPADRQTSFNLAANPAFNDPAITSGRFASPVLVPAMPEGYHNSSSMISPSQVAYGPPPGLTYPPGISSNPAAPGLTTPEIGENTTRFYNSAETVKKLGKILYPEAPIGLPDGVDLLVYLAFQNSRALVPISQDLLINGMTFLVEFLGRERGTRCLQQFLREARSHLSHCGWPSDMQMSKELAWRLFLTALAIKATADIPMMSFDQLKAWCFGPTVTLSTTFSFTLEELLVLDISIIPTHSLHEHLILDGDKVKVFTVDGPNGNVLLSYRYNRVAKALGIDNLGAEIMASIGALVGHDETSRFEEATRLGILPGYGQFQAVFTLIPREQQPKLLASRTVVEYAVA